LNEVQEHDREWFKDEVDRRMLEIGVYVFTELGERKAKEIAREMVDGTIVRSANFSFFEI